MITGHGIDIVDLRRFRLMNVERLKKVADKICTEFELSEFASSKLKYQYLAKIWAGKEAISKAFGTGIQGDVTWQQIQIQSTSLGRPSVQFTERLAGPVCHLSFSHEKDYLIASAILEII